MFVGLQVDPESCALCALPLSAGATHWSAWYGFHDFVPPSDELIAERKKWNEELDSIMELRDGR